MTGCGSSMTLSTQPTTIPDELRKPLVPLRTVDTPADIWTIYGHNMQSCAVCYIRYEALVEATRAREE